MSASREVIAPTTNDAIAAAGLRRGPSSGYRRRARAAVASVGCEMSHLNGLDGGDRTASRGTQASLLRELHELRDRRPVARCGAFAECFLHGLPHVAFQDPIGAPEVGGSRTEREHLAAPSRAREGC